MSKKAKIKKAKEKFYNRVSKRLETYPNYILPEVMTNINYMMCHYERQEIIRTYIEEKVHHSFFIN